MGLTVLSWAALGHRAAPGTPVRTGHKDPPGDGEGDAAVATGTREVVLRHCDEFRVARASNLHTTVRPKDWPR